MAKSPTYSALTPGAQKRKLARAAQEALWNTPQDPHIAGLVMQLRHRAALSAHSSTTIFRLLVGVILLGIGYYLGLPYLERYFEGRRLTLTETISDIEDVGRDLSTERQAVIGRLNTLLAQALVEVPMPDGDTARFWYELPGGLVLEGGNGQLAYITGPDAPPKPIPVPEGHKTLFITTISDALVIWAQEGPPLIWRPDSGPPRPRDLGLTAQVADAITVPGGVILLTDDGGRHFWATDTAPAKPLSIPPDSFVDATDNNLTTAESDGRYFIWDQTREDFLEVDLPEDFGDPVTYYSYPDRLVLETEDRSVLIVSPDLTSLQSIAADDLPGPYNYHVPAPDALIFAMDDGGFVHWHIPTGEISPIKAPDTAGDDFFPDLREIGATVFLKTGAGAMWRMDQSRLEFVPEPVPDGARIDYVSYTSDQPAFVGAERALGIWQSDKASLEWLDLPAGFAPSSWHPSAEGWLIDKGDGAAHFWSRETGTLGPPIALPDDAYIEDVRTTSAGPLVLTLNGGVLRLTDEYTRTDWEAEPAVMLIVGPDGTEPTPEDIVIQNILNLPEHLRELGSPVDQVREALLQISSQRRIVETRLASSREDLENWFTGLFQKDQQRISFRDFMSDCRDGARPPEGGSSPEPITLACTQAWQAELGRAEQNWWTTLAQQVPPGILLLFLLATLSGLYRYNLRLAGFHNARADILELASINKSGADPEALAKLAEAFAADRVDFAGAATPADQATDIAKAVISRR